LRKLLVPLVVLLTLVFIITGCGSNTPAATTPTGTTPTGTTPSATVPTSTVPTSTATTTKPTTTQPTGTTTTPTSNAKYGGFIRDVEPNSPGTPLGTPWETNGGSTYAWISLQKPLTQLVDGTLVPRLVESYDTVTDPANPSITFHVRKGIKFTDGTDLNAQAIKWNFDQAIASKMTGTVISYWKSVEVLDDYTFRVNMTTWLNKSVASFSNAVCDIVSPTAFQKNGIDWMRDHLVGTGPFMQSDFQRDISLTMVKNPNYWEAGKPYLDKIQYLWVPDEMTRIALFRSGGAEIMNLAGNGRIAQDLQNAGYKVVAQPSAVDILIPDSANADSPWSNLKVRQAADYAIDKAAIANSLGFGFWTANDQLNTPNSAAYDKNITGRKYDVAKAKQLLADAGYPNGFKTTIIAQNTISTDSLVAIASYLGKVGIQCQIQSIAQALWTTYARTGATWTNGLIFYRYSMNANPTQGMNGDFGMTTASWKSTARAPGWGDALQAALTSAKLEPALVQKCEDIFFDNAMSIALYTENTLTALANNVQESGVGDYGYAAVVYWAPQNAWLSK
jgi:peptide/nickel transport system substrate-binding protein